MKTGFPNTISRIGYRLPKILFHQLMELHAGISIYLLMISIKNLQHGLPANHSLPSILPPAAYPASTAPSVSGGTSASLLPSEMATVGLGSASVATPGPAVANGCGCGSPSLPPVDEGPVPPKTLAAWSAAAGSADSSEGLNLLTALTPSVELEGWGETPTAATMERLLATGCMSKAL